MAEVKIEEIREMFREMRESSNRALCFGEKQKDLKSELKREQHGHSLMMERTAALIREATQQNIYGQNPMSDIGNWGIGQSPYSIQPDSGYWF